jgi:hypothetical protein
MSEDEHQTPGGSKKKEKALSIMMIMRMPWAGKTFFKTLTPLPNLPILISLKDFKTELK